MTTIPQLSFRPFQGESDYTLIYSVYTESMRVDQVNDAPSLEEIKAWMAPSPRFDPFQDILFAMRQEDGREACTLGFARTRWSTGLGDQQAGGVDRRSGEPGLPGCAPFQQHAAFLQDIAERPLPAGFEVRPVQHGHMRAIWEAQRQVQAELFEYFAEMWSDEHYEAWASEGFQEWLIAG